MQITFTGHQLDVTPALRDVTTEKLERLEHRLHRVLNVSVTFTVEKLRHVAEATMHIPEATIHATADSLKDMYHAIDLMVAKLDKQLKKHKEKETEHHR